MSSSCFSLPNLVNSDEEPSPPHSPTKITTATITQTISRQLQTFASFLAPPPHQPYNPSIPPVSDDYDDDDSSSSSYKGIKKDLIEISGSFKTGLSLLSPKKAVTGILNLMQFDKGVDDDDDLEQVEVVGINDGVVDFVKEVSIRPECWIDFPLSLQNKEFKMSDVQRNHTLAIEQVIPSLSTLRQTIHNYMGEEQFWMIYFILLLPRLNENDYRLLSTPEIVQVREVHLQKLRNKNTPTGVPEDTPYGNTSSSEKGSLVNTTKREIESSNEINNATNRVKNENHEDYASSTSETGDWVRLKETSKANRSSYRERHSESSESSDWHAVEDVDL